MDERIEQFHQLGYVVVRRLLSQSTMEEVSCHVDTIRTCDPWRSREDRYFEVSALDNSSRILVRVEDFLDEHPALARILLGPDVILPVEHLLGETSTLFKDKINFKPPGCPADTLHYDQAGGWGDYASFFITVVIAVDRNRKDNAAIRFLRNGTFRRHLLESSLRRLSPEEFSEQEFEVVEADPGDAIFLDSYVPHWSPSNLSSAPRCNILLTFNRLREGQHKERYFENIRRHFSGNDPTRG